MGERETAEQAARVRVGRRAFGSARSAALAAEPAKFTWGGGYRQHTAGIGFEFADLVTRLIKGYSEHTPVTLALAHPAAAGIPLEPPLESGGRSTGRRVVSREVGWWVRRAGTRWCYIRCMCTSPLSLFIGAPVQLVCLPSYFLPSLLSTCAHLLSLSL